MADEEELPTSLCDRADRVARGASLVVRGCLFRTRFRPDGTGRLYQLIERGACQELDGRLVVQFKRSGRQPYLRAENCADQMLIAEWRAERLSIQKFPGFKRVHIAKTQLDAIVRQRCPDWQAALSNVAGVYLIADSGSGRFYVGSATGAGGIWQRWAEYVTTGHGENIRLVELLKDKGAAARLQFSILEIADTRTDNREILQRESHWKQVLLTRHHGLNA